MSFEDDDGIIDLNAIASKSAPPRAPVAPLFSEPPPAMSVDATDAAPVAAKGSGLKTGLMIGGGALVVVATIIGCVFAFRGEAPTPRTAAAAPPPPPAITAPPPATTAAPAAPAPAPAAEESTDGDAKPAAKKKGSGAKHASGGFSKPAAPVSKPAKPAAAADPCHCHGDFQCNIRCSAGR